MQNQQPILRPRQLPAVVGLSLATINRLRLRGDFPKPIKLGDQAIGFRRSDVEAWLSTRPMAHHFLDSFDLSGWAEAA